MVAGEGLTVILDPVNTVMVGGLETVREAFELSGRPQVKPLTPSRGQGEHPKIQIPEGDLSSPRNSEVALHGVSLVGNRQGAPRARRVHLGSVALNSSNGRSSPLSYGITVVREMRESVRMTVEMIAVIVMLIPTFIPRITVIVV